MKNRAAIHLVAEGVVLRTRWFFLFFFISGFCSLLYEVVWLRLSMAKFGVTTPMVSIVLSVFMAGLGIGSWTGGALIRRLGRVAPAVPLRLYGALEVSIGLSGLLVPAILGFGYHLLRDAGRGVAWGSSLYYLASGAWVAVALLPWCTCMGATFPFAMAAIRGLNEEESPRSFSFLYLANVLGAIAGALVPAIFLIELFGFHITLRIASALNGLLAAMVFLYARSLPRAEKAPPAAQAIAASVEARTGFLWLLFTTGLCSMAMEVVWTRQYTIYLGNVVYAFASILAVYLAATFAGSTLYRRWARTHPRANSPAAWICLGFLALLPLWFADPRLLWGADFADDNFLLGLFRAVCGIAPFSAIAGFLTPMLVDRWSGGDPDRAGRAYAMNVLGSILGPLVAGFWILPWAGERWGLCLIALPLFAIGCASAVRASASIFGLPLRALFAGAVAGSVLMAATTRGYDSIYPQRIELRDYTATVIAAGKGMNRRLLVNGIGMTRLTTITKMMAHLPLSMLSRPAASGLVICFGMGTTFRSMLSWGIQATVVDLVPSVPKLFGYYHPDAGALLHSPLAHVVIDDGRRFLERSAEQFDVIATDPPPPLEAPTSSLLYSQEFYSIVQKHLRPGGIVQVWCPGGDDVSVAAIAEGLRQSFPYVRAYQSVEGWGLH
ncbi:MAG TPA: fused MFS/spermidine synthase, partial [Bryobacteraceae bacterium]|nr:fused MFS/spermidine synthase [Bryobacteraceae bacterium]